jgi:glutathione S-transferase
MSLIKEKDFLAKNPNGKVPVLEVKENTYIFESNAILRYVGRLGKYYNIYGTDDLQASQIDQWLDWSANELEPSLGKLLYPVLGHVPFDKDTNQKALDDTKKAFKILDHHLSTHSHLVGS